MLRAVEITRDTVDDYLRLKVTPEQEAASLVAPNPVTVAQQRYEPGSLLRGLEVGGTPVGLLAMIDFGAPERDGINPGPPDPRDGALVWRLMIGAAHQRQGYGRAALELARQQARDWGRRQILLWVVDVPAGAMAFYRHLGYRPTGQIEDDETEMARPVAD